MGMSGELRRWALGAVALLAAGLGGLALALPGLARPRDREADSRGVEEARSGSLVQVGLPEEPVRMPPGPHRAEVTANCRVCHSPRLVLTQPRLTRAEWAAVVKKMVDKYGASIRPDRTEDMVTYLVTVHGR